MAPLVGGSEEPSRQRPKDRVAVADLHVQGGIIGVGVVGDVGHRGPVGFQQGFQPIGHVQVDVLFFEIDRPVVVDSPWIGATVAGVQANLPAGQGPVSV